MQNPELLFVAGIVLGACAMALGWSFGRINRRLMRAASNAEMAYEAVADLDGRLQEAGLIKARPIYSSAAGAMPIFSSSAAARPVSVQSAS